MTADLEFIEHLGWVIDVTFLMICASAVIALLIVLFETLKPRVLEAIRWKDWREGKIFIFEDICIFSFVLICNFASDGFYNFLHDLELVSQPRPYSFGLGQIAITVFFGSLLVRKIKQLRYFR